MAVRRLFLMLALCMYGAILFVNGCASPNSIGDGVSSPVTTVVSGLKAQVQGESAGCTFTSYDKDTDVLEYTCTPATCTSTCFDGTSKAGVKECSTKYNAAAKTVEIFCGCKSSCSVTDPEPSMEPAPDSGISDMGGVDADMSDSAGEVSGDAGVSEQMSEGQADTPPTCGANETLVDSMCVCNAILNSTSSKPWHWEWCTSATGTYAIFRGTTAVTCGTAIVQQMSITEYHWRCIGKKGDTTHNDKCTTNAAQNTSKVQVFTHNAKTFSYAKLPSGWDPKTSEGYPKAPQEVDTHWYSCFKDPANNEWYGMQCIDWSWEAGNCWQSAAP